MIGRRPKPRSLSDPRSILLKSRGFRKPARRHACWMRARGPPPARFRASLGRPIDIEVHTAFDRNAGRKRWASVPPNTARPRAGEPWSLAMTASARAPP